MVESTGKPRALKSKTKKAKVEKNRAEKIDTSRVASAKNGSSRGNAGVKVDDMVRANSGAEMNAGAKAQTGAKADAAVKLEAIPVGFAMNPTNYVNRKLSWLESNYRVLNESRDKNIPLLERLKFLSITTSNLDEFYIIKVASLKGTVHAEYIGPDIANLTPREQLDRINRGTHELVEIQYSTCNHSLVPILRQNRSRTVTEHEDMTKERAAYTDEYFRENVYPVLMPMTFNSSRSLSLVRNKTLNIAAFLGKKSGEDEEPEFAMVQVPLVIFKIVELSREIDEDGKERKVAILLEGIIEQDMSPLFLDYDIVASHLLRIMENVDPTIDEEEAVDLLEEIQRQFRKRQWDEAIRLEVEGSVDKRLLKIIRREPSVDSQDIFEINDPLNLVSLMKMYGLEDFKLFKAFRYVLQPVPTLMNEDDTFIDIRKGDILFHHPYQSFNPVVSFIRSATQDQSVLTIKRTLYRVSGNSPIIAASAGVTDNGKQVLVPVGLKVCFDEGNSINWTEMLEKAGYHVVYGLVGLKTHSKITLVVRVEGDGIRHYVHLGTGNYNDSTAKPYTDCGVLTCSPRIGEDATAVFNMLSGYSGLPVWNKLSVAPLWLRRRFLCMIRREAEHAREGRPVHIMTRVNSLCDKEATTTLYEASCAGMKVEMTIRGICCLKVGVPGLSENISARSIIGDFLGHSRIFYFFNDASPEVYMDSADWMPRDLNHRVEIMFPVEDGVLREKVIHIPEVELEDNVEAHIFQPDGSYEKEDKRGKVLINSQEQFCREAILVAEESADQEDPARSRVFRPVMNSNQGYFGKKRSRKNI